MQLFKDSQQEKGCCAKITNKGTNEVSPSCVVSRDLDDHAHKVI